eukprot:4766985-Prorocentrum_lima.AAC.1
MRAAYAEEFERADDHHDIRDGPAILFADQAKAFERVPWPWLLKITQRWGAPRWIQQAVRALVCQRE